MLRITTSSAAGPTVLRLEGRLIGPWVSLFEEELDKAGAGGAVVLEVSLVQFADREGLTALANAARRGCSLAGCSPLLTSMLERASG